MAVKYLLVFPDGETYSELEGCKVVQITDDQLDQLDRGMTMDDLLRTSYAKVVAKFAESGTIALNPDTP